MSHGVQSLVAPRRTLPLCPTACSPRPMDAVDICGSCLESGCPLGAILPGSLWGVVLATAFLVLLPEPLRFIDIDSSYLGPARQLLQAIILFSVVRRYVNS